MASRSSQMGSTSESSAASFDEARVRLGEASLRLLEARAPCAAERNELREQLEPVHRDRVHHGSGFVVIGGLDVLTPERWPEAFRRVCGALGRLMRQHADAPEIREVRDRGTRIGEGRSACYSDSREGGSLHTDGAECAHPLPDCFALCCIRQAASGGHLQLVAASALRGRLEQTDPDALQILSEPFHFDRRGEPGPEGELTVHKPVFTRERAVVTANYLREYIEVGHRQPGVPALTAAQTRALDRMDELLRDRTLVIQDRLLPGEIVVVDNTRMLHGRTAFEDGPLPHQRRLLLRAWIRHD
jgi:Taurine catabolism dioxygenase TauD, TfdA family